MAKNDSLGLQPEYVNAASRETLSASSSDSIPIPSTTSTSPLPPSTSNFSPALLRGASAQGESLMRGASSDRSKNELKPSTVESGGQGPSDTPHIPHRGPPRLRVGVGPNFETTLSNKMRAHVEQPSNAVEADPAFDSAAVDRSSKGVVVPPSAAHVSSHSSSSSESDAVALPVPLGTPVSMSMGAAGPSAASSNVEADWPASSSTSTTNSTAITRSRSGSTSNNLRSRKASISSTSSETGEKASKKHQVLSNYAASSSEVGSNTTATTTNSSSVTTGSNPVRNLSTLPPSTAASKRLSWKGLSPSPLNSPTSEAGLGLMLAREGMGIGEPHSNEPSATRKGRESLLNLGSETEERSGDVPFDENREWGALNHPGETPNSSTRSPLTLNGNGRITVTGGNQNYHKVLLSTPPPNHVMARSPSPLLSTASPSSFVAAKRPNSPASATFSQSYPSSTHTSPSSGMSHSTYTMPSLTAQTMMGSRESRLSTSSVQSNSSFYSTSSSSTGVSMGSGANTPLLSNASAGAAAVPSTSMSRPGNFNTVPVASTLTSNGNGSYASLSHAMDRTTTSSKSRDSTLMSVHGRQVSLTSACAPVTSSLSNADRSAMDRERFGMGLGGGLTVKTGATNYDVATTAIYPPPCSPGATQRGWGKVGDSDDSTPRSGTTSSLGTGTSHRQGGTSTVLSYPNHPPLLPISSKRIRATRMVSTFFQLPAHALSYLLAPINGLGFYPLSNPGSPLLSSSSSFPSPADLKELKGGVGSAAGNGTSGTGSSLMMMNSNSNHNVSSLHHQKHGKWPFLIRLGTVVYLMFSVLFFGLQLLNGKVHLNPFSSNDFQSSYFSSNPFFHNSGSASVKLGPRNGLEMEAGKFVLGKVGGVGVGEWAQRVAAKGGAGLRGLKWVGSGQDDGSLTTVPTDNEKILGDNSNGIEFGEEEKDEKPIIQRVGALPAAYRTAKDNPLSPLSHTYRFAKMHDKAHWNLHDEIVPYMFQAAVTPKPDDVTACFYSNEAWLATLSTFVRAWDGPVSLVFETAHSRTSPRRADLLERIAALRKSDNMVRDHVSFHLVGTPPHTKSRTLNKMRERMIRKPLWQNFHSNIARFFAPTDIVFMAGDARLVPSMGLRTRLASNQIQKLVLENGDAIVVPTFGFLRGDSILNNDESVTRASLYYNTHDLRARLELHRSSGTWEGVGEHEFELLAQENLRTLEVSVPIIPEDWPNTKEKLMELVELISPDDVASEEEEGILAAANGRGGAAPGSTLAMFDRRWELNQGPTNYLKWSEQQQQQEELLLTSVSSSPTATSDLYKVEEYDLHYAPFVVMAKRGQPWCTERFEIMPSACVYQMYLAGAGMWVLPDEWVYTIEVVEKSPPGLVKVDPAEKLKNSISARLYGKFHQEACMHYGREFLSVQMWDSDKAQHLRKTCVRTLYSWGMGSVS